MRRIAFLGFMLALLAPLRAAAAPRLAVAPLALPPGAEHATAFNALRGDDGRTYLLWIETAGAHPVLRLARQAADDSWDPAVTVATGADPVVDATDVPAFAVDRRGRLTVAWLQPAHAAGNPSGHAAGGSAYFSRSLDGGRTWSPPESLAAAGRSVEFPALAALADGDVLAVWLETGTTKNVRLVGRTLGAPGPEKEIDAAVCECCPPALLAFPDGTALLAYRGRTEENVRDIRSARFRAGTWTESRPLNQDDWRLAGCPVNGPALAGEGGRVAAAWFTAADNDPRLLVSASPDAGGRFLYPLRLGENRPTGRPAAAILRDGALLAAWIDGAGGLRLRRVTPEFSLSVETELAAPASVSARGRPRLLVREDYAGGRESARLLAFWPQAGRPALRAAVVTVPEGELLEAEKSCDCAPTPDQLRGYPFFGTVVSTFTDTAEIAVRHGEVPGLLPAGERRFRAAPDVLAAAAAGRRFLGRFEAAGDGWRLFDVRFVAASP